MSSNRVVNREKARNVVFQPAGHAASFEAQATGGKARSPKKPRDLDEIEREAFQKGFESGQKSGLQMADQKIEAVVKRFAQSLEEVASLRGELIRDTERDLVELSIEIAQKLVYREIQIDEKIIVTLVRVAMEKLTSGSRIQVSLNPEDHAILSTHLSQLTGEGKETRVELLIKEDLKRGDCLLESDYGSVDARMVEQFKEVEAGLLSGF